MCGDGSDTVTGESTYLRNSSGYVSEPSGIRLSDKSLLSTGAGDDRITGIGGFNPGILARNPGIYVGDDAKIDTGDGNDLITGDYIRMFNGTISTGSGDDTIDAPVAVAEGYNTIDMGDGIDRVRFKSVIDVESRNGGWVVRSALTSSIQQITLLGCEFIGGPNGDWQQLAAGRYYFQ